MLVRATPDRKYQLEVTGVPFTTEKDTYGTTFTKTTDFMEDYMRLPPVFYYHGSYRGQASRTIARATERFMDDEGVKFIVTLNPDDPLTPMLWQNALAGNLYASTGVVPASYEKTDTGVVRSWFIGDLSLFEMDRSTGKVPASLHAVAKPLLEEIVRAAGRTMDGVTFDKTGSDVTIPALKLASPEEITFAQKLQMALKPLLDFLNLVKVIPSSDIPVEGQEVETEDPAPPAEDPQTNKEKNMDDATRAAAQQAEIDKLRQELEIVRSAAASATAKTAETEFSKWLDGNAVAKFAPADREALLSAYRALRTMDETVRSGSTTAVDVLKAVIGLVPNSLPVVEEKNLFALGNRSTQKEGEIDPAYVERMKQYA